MNFITSLYEISFIECNRTIRKSIKLDRLKRTAVTAMKQTLKAKIPKINDIQNFYSNYKDSIPSVPEYYSFSIIDIQHKEIIR